MSELAVRIEALRQRLEPARVDALLEAARQAGATALPADEHVVFGFVQRVLNRLKNAGHNYGLVFPKTDGHYRRFFDYFDGDGRIVSIYPGEEPGMLAIAPDWSRPVEVGGAVAYQEIMPGKEEEIAVSFLEAYAALRALGEAGRV